MDIKTFQDIKAKHEEAILLFRVGDFYEAYDVDASIISSILGITLTQDTENDINMAGFPNTMLDTYLPKLIKAGKRVAMVDEADKKAKGKTQADTAASELAKIKRENKQLKERVKELAMERDRAMAEAQENVHELCSRLIAFGGLPDEAYELIHEHIGIKEVVRIKVENKIAPSLEEIKTLLKKVDDLEKED